MNPVTVTGIVVTHGRLGEELLKTARTIVGDFPNCHSVSNRAKTPQRVSAEIQQIIDETGGRPSIIFVDFMGGSCSNACLSIEGGQQVFVISGISLPMLLAFLNKRSVVPFDELPAAILERSHSSIQVLDPSEI